MAKLSLRKRAKIIAIPKIEDIIKGILNFFKETLEIAIMK